MKEKQTRKSNYSTVRWFFLVWSSLNFPAVFLCVIDCVIWLLDWFLVHCRSSFLPDLHVNLLSYSVSKCWQNYSSIMLLLKGMCSTKVPHREIFANYDLSDVGNYSGKNFRSDLTSIWIFVAKKICLYLQ